MLSWLLLSGRQRHDECMMQAAADLSVPEEQERGQPLHTEAIRQMGLLIHIHHRMVHRHRLRELGPRSLIP